MAWNLPDGCTDGDVDRAAGGYDQDPGEDPENLQPWPADQEPEINLDDGCSPDCPF